MKLNNFFNYFRQKYKLSLRNIRTGDEIWHLFVSRIRIILVGFAVVLLMFVAILTIVAYTPVLDLIPGYPGNRARKALVSNIMRLDSLERMVVGWEDYHTNLALILEGRDPVPFDPDSLPRLGVKSTPTPRSQSDSLLRRLIESDSSYMAPQSQRRGENHFEIMPPVTGTLTRRFDPLAGFFGVEITPLPNQAIMSVMDGTVVINSWDPVSGYLIAVQHTGNMMSVCKTSARVLKQTGERVRAGEALAVSPSAVSGRTADLIFELWYNGNPVDPENYITF